MSSDHSDEDTVFADGDTLGAITAQSIRWSHYQPRTWMSLLDEHYREIDPVIFTVEADKGFNYLSYDDSFVCQKKNHFQITVRVGLNTGSATPQYVYDAASCTAVPIDAFYLHFYGIKRELPSYRIQIEQSTPDRVKHPLQPVKVTLSAKDVTKVIVYRLHFSETTSNNMRKRGKPNPDQRYIQLVVSLCAHRANTHYLLAAQLSDKIIVRASNPGQFEGDADTSWMRGKSVDSIYHMGSVGINTDCTDEALTVHGNVRLTGKLTSPSDIRAKTHLQELDSNAQLENISKLKVYSYKFTDEFADYAGLPANARHDTGVLAQDVRDVLPDAVLPSHSVTLPTGDVIDNFLVVNKDRIFFENIGAVKELCKVTGKLEMRISEMEEVNRRLTKTTTLYVIERQDGQDNSSPVLQNDTTNGSFNNVIPVATVTPPSDRPLFNVAQCGSTNNDCPVVCCPPTVLPDSNSPSTISPVGAAVGPINVSTSATTSASSVASALRYFTGNMERLMPPSTTSAHAASAAVTVPDDSDQWPIRPMQFFHTSTTTTTTSSSVTVMLRSPSTMSTSASRRRSMKSGRMESASGPAYDMRMAGIKPNIVKRHVVAVNVMLAGDILSDVYCQNDACRSQTGGNFTYYIPLRPTMPANSTLTLQLIGHSVQSSAVLCDARYQLSCSETTSATANKRDNVTWSLPVGFYRSSTYMFRVALHSTSTSQSICEDGSVKVDVDFYELTFRFERRCHH